MLVISVRRVIFISMPRPFALLITWTCYGTWLPGDRRGFVSNAVQPGRGWLPKLNTPGTPYRADEPAAYRLARQLQRRASVRLDVAEARRVATALRESAERRGWRILRAAVMAKHVHVVVAECPPDASVVRRALKGVSQAALNRLAGAPKRWWTAGGSDRYLNDESSIDAAVAYVANQRGILAEIVGDAMDKRRSWPE